jgi:hypothetical protein
MMAVLVLGLVPEVLALVGFGVSLRRRMFLPLTTFVVLTLAAYVWWLIPQDTWALKPKYVLALLPPAALYAMVGQAWLLRGMPVVGVVAAGLLAALVVLAHIYLYAFAMGRL